MSTSTDASTPRRRAPRQPGIEAADSDFQEQISQHIRSLMVQHELSQTDLAAAMGVSRKYVWQLLHGWRRFNLANLSRISRHLGYRLVLRLEKLKP